MVILLSLGALCWGAPSQIASAEEVERSYSATEILTPNGRPMGGSASSGSSLQMSPNFLSPQQTFFIKEVNGELWSMAYTPASGNMTGNVFNFDGSPGQFLQCQEVDEDIQNKYFNCWGSSACMTAVCPASGDWTDLGITAVPQSFFRPRPPVVPTPTPTRTPNITPTPGCGTNSGRFPFIDVSNCSGVWVNYFVDCVPYNLATRVYKTLPPGGFDPTAECQGFPNDVSVLGIQNGLIYSVQKGFAYHFAQTAPFRVDLFFNSSSRPTPVPTSNPQGQIVSIPQGAAGLGPAGYGPNPLIISAGTTITWVNNDFMAHTATSNTGLWDSGIIPPGGSYSRTFSQPGTYVYYCTLHGFQSMNGVIEVSP